MANRWYQKAGEAGCDWGWDNLGDDLENGRGTPVDIDKALECYTKSYALAGPAAGGSANAIGRIQAKRGNYQEAVKWSRLAGEAGCDWGWHNLGDAYRLGEGVPVDLKKAKKCYLKAFALQDYAAGEAANQLGLLYARQGAVKEARSWYQKSGEAGFDWGWHNLGQTYWLEEHTVPNLNNALTYFVKAYNLNGEAAGPSANQLGLIYNLQEEYKMANLWLKRSGKAGYDWGWFNLAVNLQDGKGCKANPQEACRIYKDLYNQGGEAAADAAYFLGLCYAQEDRLSQANGWFQKGQEAGSPWAALALARNLQEGCGITKDPKKALAICQEIYAQGGETQAQAAELIGNWYWKKGQLEEAEKWYQKGGKA